MINIRKSRAGFTLIEIVTALAISGILFAAAATAFSAFFSKYEEYIGVTNLERQAYDCLQRGIKYGLVMNAEAGGREWYGVATADSLKFINGGPTGSGGIRLYTQAQSIEHQNDWVQFWYDGRAVRGSYLHGTLSPSSPIYVFPKPSRNNKITVTNLRFTQVNSSNPPKVIQVDLAAKVEIRKNVFRYVNYTTKMAINKM
jgi:prepilin-type N-terminal cleavage/methylation domain-containing protein